MKPPRWPLWITGAAALAWLALGIAAVVIAGDATSLPPRLIIAGEMMLGLAAPVAVIALVALRLTDSHAVRAERTAALSDAAWQADHRLDEAGALLDRFEARFAALGEQLGTVATAVAAHDERLAAGLAGFDTRSAALTRAADAATQASAALAETVPAATLQAATLHDRLGATDADLQGQLAQTRALMVAVDSAAATASRQIAGLIGAADAAAAALGAPIAALNAAGVAALGRADAAVAATHEALLGHADALAVHAESARASLHHIGDDAAGRAEKHLGHLQAAAAQLTGEIDHQAARYAVFIEQLERGFGTLDARLVASVAAGRTGLDTIASGMVEARDAINALAAPIEASRNGIAGVASGADAARTATETAMLAIDATLPAAAGKVAAMTTELAALRASAGRLSTPIDAGTATIAAANDAMASARAGLETSARRVGDALAAALAVIADIETRAGGTALASAAQLVDVFGRVRDVANQTAGTMRASLSAVVAEAETALAEAGSARADAAFGTPVRAALAELAAANTRTADTAQVAAERITARLLALTATVADVERRRADADNTQDRRIRDDIASRSASLLASMDAAAIDIAALLGAEIDAAAWGRWLAGDRGLFLRRAVRVVDARTAAAIAGHWNGQSDFREVATRFIGEFEALIARVQPEGKGRDLALALLSSDPGKLYIALSQSTDRLK